MSSRVTIKYEQPPRKTVDSGQFYTLLQREDERHVVMIVHIGKLLYRIIDLETGNCISNLDTIPSITEFLIKNSAELLEGPITLSIRQ